MLNQIQSSKDQKNFIEQGFTLVELLIVIVILGILAGIVVFAVGNLTSGSTQKACQTEASTFATAFQSYKASNNNQPPAGTTVELQGETMKGLAQPLLTFGTKMKYLDGAAGGAQANGKGWTGNTTTGIADDTNCATAA